MSWRYRQGSFIINGALLSPFVTVGIVGFLCWLTSGWIAIVFMSLLSTVVAISLSATIGAIVWASVSGIWRKVSG